jgi:DNA recombination protein RmuC
MREEFEHIAQRILTENRVALTQENRVSLDTIITPFKENIKAFHDRVESYYTDESKERYSLTNEIHNLQKLNQRISEDAINLTNALKGDNKVQGDWGEMILERVLENSGLKKEREYYVQASHHDKEGRLFRPDVIVQLPDNKHIIIDSKVSLKSYEQYHHDKSNQTQHKKAFIHSVKSHIKELSHKSYQTLEGVNSLDFVLLFVPIEGAFSLLQEAEVGLYEDAYQKNIILVSPSTLLAVLRVIENSWRIEYQNKNAKIIAKKAGDLYSKFESFVAEMRKIDSSLKKAQSAYDDAFKRLSTGRGNLIDKTNELKELEGVVAKEKRSK